jgi:putative membrane protein
MRKPRTLARSNEPNHLKPAAGLDTATKLAFERTYLAYERTQMAWVRTSLTLISFGFTIAKFFEFLHEKNQEHLPRMAPRSVGTLMIAIGLLALALASVQHHRAIRVLRKESPNLPASLAGVTAVLLALLGILAFVGTMVRF